MGVTGYLVSLFYAIFNPMKKGEFVMAAIGSTTQTIYIDENGNPQVTEAKAPVKSPVFSGVPLAPTASDTDTGTNQIATLSWVITRITNWWSNLCSNTATTVKKLWTFNAGISAASVTDTGVKSAAALCTDSTGKITAKTVDSTPTGSSTNTNLVTSGGVKVALDAKAPLESPTFTGTPTLTTPVADGADNTTLATTAWVRTRITNWWNSIISSVQSITGTWTISIVRTQTLSDRDYTLTSLTDNAATFSWVIRRISNWWSNVCTNVETNVAKLWTFNAGISANGITDTDCKNYGVIGTNTDGKLTYNGSNPILGVNPITDKDNDTVATWKTIKPGTYHFNTDGVLYDQPYQHGFLEHIIIASEIKQIFHCQPNGEIYVRSANAAGTLDGKWNTTWTRMVSSKDLAFNVGGNISIVLADSDHGGNDDNLFKQYKEILNEVGLGSRTPLYSINAALRLASMFARADSIYIYFNEGTYTYTSSQYIFGINSIVRLVRYKVPDHEEGKKLKSLGVTIQLKNESVISVQHSIVVINGLDFEDKDTSPTVNTISCESATISIFGGSIKGYRPLYARHSTVTLSDYDLVNKRGGSKARNFKVSSGRIIVDEDTTLPLKLTGDAWDMLELNNSFVSLYGKIQIISNLMTNNGGPIVAQRKTTVTNSAARPLQLEVYFPSEYGRIPNLYIFRLIRDATAYFFRYDGTHDDFLTGVSDTTLVNFVVKSGYPSISGPIPITENVHISYPREQDVSHALREGTLQFDINTSDVTDSTKPGYTWNGDKYVPGYEWDGTRYVDKRISYPIVGIDKGGNIVESNKFQIVTSFPSSPDPDTFYFLLGS